MSCCHVREPAGWADARGQRRQEHRQLGAKTLGFWLCLLAAMLVAQNGNASKREVPDYDGRGGRPTRPGDVLLWGPRVVLFPLYVVSEFVVRRPLGWLISSAERAQVPAALYNFFTFGPDHNAGIIPVAFLDFGFQPSVGIYSFWDNAGFKGHGLRLHASTGGADWLAGSFTERFRLAEARHLTLKVGAIRRPDYAFYGVGPRTAEDALSRYGADRFEARAVIDARFLGIARVEGGFGFRSMVFTEGDYLGDPTVEERAESGIFPLPDGYERGYQAGFSRLKLTLDSRGAAARSRSGARVELDAEQGTDLEHSRPSSWLRYGAALGGFVDLHDSGRVVSLSLATEFSDPLGSEAAPFTELPTLGGPALMPGFREGRLRGRSAAVATLRYTWPIWIWLDGTLQGAVGNVFGNKLEGLDPGLLRLSAALGIESHGSPDSALQILVGFGTETFDDGARVDSIRLTLGARGGL